MAWRLLRAIRRFDTFVFVWRYSFLPLQLDIPLLRLLGKRVVVFFCGDDVRYKPIQMELDRRRGAQPWWPEGDSEALASWMEYGRTFFEAFWSVKLIEKSGCKIVATPDATTFQGRTYSGFMLPQDMLVPEPRPAAEVPLIVHAPSLPSLKGSRQVEEAIERLREEGHEFRFELVQGVPVGELMDILRGADIVIDQPGVWVSRLAIAGMAAGAAVVGGNQPDFWHLPDESPVLQFERDSEQLAGVLRPLVEDRAGREQLMRDCWEYARRMYSYEAFVEFFEQVLDDEPWPIEPLPGQKQFVRSLAPDRLARAAVTVLW
jgi:hypothetical protein